MRLLFYPGLAAEDADELTPGIGDHTDFECYTILRQQRRADNAPALQVRNHGGEWVDAPFIEDTFVVNIGDQLMRWTSA
jgi:isopenicillin N synthase-like dioxygenase